MPPAETVATPSGGVGLDPMESGSVTFHPYAGRSAVLVAGNKAARDSRRVVSKNWREMIDLAGDQPKRIFDVQAVDVGRANPEAICIKAEIARRMKFFELPDAAGASSRFRI